MSISDTQRKRCHAIIHSAATLAGAVGFAGAQLPTADNVILVPIQISMIISLGEVFGKHIQESTAIALLSSATATTVGRGVSQWMVGWIPGWGNVINATTAASITEGVGWVTAKTFSKFGNLEEGLQ